MMHKIRSLIYHARKRLLPSGRGASPATGGPDAAGPLVAIWSEEHRLDHVINRLESSQRLSLGGKVVMAALERDIESGTSSQVTLKDIYVVEGVPHLPVSLEQEQAERVESGDGGTEEPAPANRLTAHLNSVAAILDVAPSALLDAAQASLRHRLHNASLTFQTVRENRHACKAQRIYNAFSLPNFVVESHEAQRDCAKRLSRFRIKAEDIKGKRIIDLGSNIGGILFEAQQHGPAYSLGVEYDVEKVQTARLVAAFGGASNVSFMQADIDELTLECVGGPYDVTFCLAVEAHVKRPAALYELLGKITLGTLYFEGNSSTSVDAIRGGLDRNGFRSIEYIGSCDDDCVPANNCRPMFRAMR